MLRDGDEVYYSGDGQHGGQVGDVGRVLSAGGGAAHVKWASGGRAGLVSLEDADDLEPRRTVAALLEDSIEFGDLRVEAAREAYDEQGAHGVLAMLAERGHLMSFAEIAEEALTLVAARVRRDPSVREAIGQLDEDEGDQVVRVASAALIYDAFSLE